MYYGSKCRTVDVKCIVKESDLAPVRFKLIIILLIHSAPYLMVFTVPMYNPLPSNKVLTSLHSKMPFFLVSLIHVGGVGELVVGKKNVREKAYLYIERKVKVFFLICTFT